MCVVDSGIAFNSPFPVLLRPERKVELILSFDLSQRDNGDKEPPFHVSHFTFICSFYSIDGYFYKMSCFNAALIFISTHVLSTDFRDFAHKQRSILLSDGKHTCQKYEIKLQSSENQMLGHSIVYVK